MNSTDMSTSKSELFVTEVELGGPRDSIVPGDLDAVVRAVSCLPSGC